MRNLVKANIKQRDSEGYSQQISAALRLLGRFDKPAITAAFTPVFPVAGQNLPCDGSNNPVQNLPFDPIFNVVKPELNAGPELNIGEVL